MGAVYFRELIQDIEEKAITNNDASDIIPTNLLENLMFEKVSYDPEIDPLKENYTKQTTFIKSEFASEA
jgi:hypothetical protein